MESSFRNPPLPTGTLATVKSLRRSMTDAERHLWHRLRGGGLCGLKFRRQHPVPPYVLDFYCAEAALVVELDGSQHGLTVDSVRTRALEQKGLLVVRFWDHDALLRVDAVLEQILRIAGVRTITGRAGPQTPLPPGEGQG